MAVRDSQDPAGPALILTPAAWRALTFEVRNGELNLTAAPSAHSQSLRNRSSSHSTAGRRTRVQPGDFAEADAMARMHGRKSAVALLPVHTASRLTDCV